MEDYYLVLAPDFELSPTEFVAIWNAEQECRATAVARLIPPASQQFDFTLFAGIALGVVTNVASSALYDLIKKVVTKREGVKKHVHIEALQKPDGTRFLVVDSEEK